MTTCRTVADARALGRAAGQDAPPISQALADLVAAIRAQHNDDTDRVAA